MTQAVLNNSFKLSSTVSLWKTKVTHHIIMAVTRQGRWGTLQRITSQMTGLDLWKKVSLYKVPQEF